ncbi:MAG: type IV pilus twitching motility protein PilT [Fibrobacteria bacterium]
MDIRQLLSFAKERNASDLHLSAGSVPIVRIDGLLLKLKLPAMENEELREAVYGLLHEGQKAAFETRYELDFSWELDADARYRVNLFQQLRGMAAVFRLIPTQIRTFDDLGLPAALKTLCLRDRGLILVTGPTGSGKSTTLAAMVDYINENQQKHIITIEDPIEFIHKNKGCLINQREVGQHSTSFQAALRVALREDPDVILIGEMRDLETVQLALTAAETGHLVMSTLHTGSAAKTIDRIVDIFPPESKGQIRSMLSESLVAVFSQKLLPRKEGKGRAMALEALVANTAVRNLIREDKVYQLANVMQSGGAQGMATLDMALQDLVQRGVVARDEAAKLAVDPSKLK